MRLRANESVAKKLKCLFQGCLKSYDRSDRLKHHFLTHLSIRTSGEKLFECDYKYCGKKLTQLVQIEAINAFTLMKDHLFVLSITVIKNLLKIHIFSNIIKLTQQMQ
jgi:hypothetical protein